MQDVVTHRLELTEPDFVTLSAVVTYAVGEMYKSLEAYSLAHPGIAAEDTPTSAMGPIGGYMAELHGDAGLPDNFIEGFTRHVGHVVEELNEAAQMGANELARLSRLMDHIEGMVDGVDSMRRID